VERAVEHPRTVEQPRAPKGRGTPKGRDDRNLSQVDKTSTQLKLDNQLRTEEIKVLEEEIAGLKRREEGQNQLVMKLYARRIPPQTDHPAMPIIIFNRVARSTSTTLLLPRTTTVPFPTQMLPNLTWLISLNRIYSPLLI